MLPTHKTIKIKCTVCFIYVFCQSQTSYAGEEITTLEPLVVKAPRETLSQLIRNSEQLDQEDLTRMHQRSISDILQGSPGFSFTRFGGYGQPGASFMRGAGGQGIMTLDDIPLLQTVPGSQISNTIPGEAIQSVSIDRGPSAAFHSFQALGGAIRMTTLEREQTGAKLTVEGGSFGLLRETLQAGLVGSLGKITATLTRADAFDGTHLANSFKYPERDKFNYTQAILRFSSDITSRLNWQGSMLYQKTLSGADKFGLDSNGLVETQDDANSYGHQETWLAQNRLTMAVTDNWESQLQLGYTQSATFINAGPLFNSVFSRLYLVNWNNRHKIVDNPDQHRQWQFVWGGQGRYELGKSPNTGFSQHRTSTAGFMSTEFQYGDFSGETGIRIEDFDRYGTHPLFHTTGVWQVTPRLSLRASGGTGYRLPSYTELLFLFFGNQALKPERAASGEFGIVWLPIENMRLTANGFYHHYQDLISIAFDPNPDFNRPGADAAYNPRPRFGPLSANIANARTAGFELTGQYCWGNGLDSGFSYTFSDNRDLNTDLLVPLKPRHIAKFWQEWRISQLPLTLRLETFYRNSTWNDFKNTLPVDDSVQINASVRYRINSNFEAFLRGENLTDNRHAVIYSADMPGVSVYGGFQVEF